MMKYILLMAALLAVCGSAVSETYNLQCQAIGYAYSYDSKTFYESRKVAFNYKSTSGCVLDSGRTHVKNEWHSFFSSEVSDYFNYTLGVHSDCQCHDKAASGVSRRHQDFKRSFVTKGFSVWRMRGFDPDDRDF